MSTAVTIEGIGKKYKIGAAHERATTLRDAITSAATAPVRRLRHAGSSTGHVSEFWALRDVTFAVEAGQVIGIIGRNGAGKSTLLKILSRITHPTTGKAVIRGRVGSLLEVGTGFHQELSGRENIYLNGAILGMSRNEIGRKFDEIVDFSEIGDFLDTPVKRYSSGMFVRLAFAVAAHLEPEVLIVDEVLAVGDVTFQRKCIGKMEDVADEGRTVLFVSHNMHAVRSLCSHAVQLEAGRVINEGASGAVVDEYLRIKDQAGAAVSWPRDAAPGDDEVKLLGVSVLDADAEPAQVLNNDEPFRVRLDLDVARLDEALCVGFDMASADGSVVFRSYHTDRAPELWPEVTPGRNALECEVPAGLLNEGRFMILPRISIHKQRWIVHGDGVINFDVHRVPTESPYTFTERPGPVAPVVPWSRVDPPD